MLTERFDDALAYAAQLHRTQTRKGGGGVPYIGHLLSVAGLVIEGGGTETQAIAGLLHDAVEDQGGAPVLVEIRGKFGDEVAHIVAECTDADVTPKPPWRPRKQAYIDHLADVSEATLLVSLADKLDNARAILRDHRLVGDELWQRFSVSDPQQHLWYYTSLLDVFQRRIPNVWLVDELARVLAQLRERVVAAGSLCRPSAHSTLGLPTSERQRACRHPVVTARWSPQENRLQSCPPLSDKAPCG